MKTSIRGLAAAVSVASALASTGCFGGMLGGSPAGNDSVPASDAIKSDTRMTQVDLDQFCMGFGERYLTLIGNACNSVEKSAKEPELQTRAHSFKLQAASSVYDLATGANPFAKLMDLILLAELQDLVWGREGLAVKVFGADAGAHLVAALKEGREEAWKLGDRILKPDQRSALESMIAEWRQAHPSAESVAFVRFDDFAQYRGKTVLDGVPLGSGLLAPVTEATRQLAETRLLAERAMYLAKRMPLLIRWHAESLLNTTLTRPEITDLRRTASRIAEVAEEMPGKIANERVTVLQAAQERVDHAGHVARRIAYEIAGLTAGLIVLTFILLHIYRKMAPREAKAAAVAPAPAPKPRQHVND
jgi:hypothetical protein